jgi:hypothetical protein
MLFQGRSLATAVSLAPQFLLRANMPQYETQLSDLKGIEKAQLV